MNIENSLSLHKKREMGDEMPFGPRTVNINYNAYNSSIDSRMNDSRNSKPSLRNSEIDYGNGIQGRLADTMAGTRGDNTNKLDKRTVKFCLEPDVFLVKSYKKFNRTGKHNTSCLCKVF